MKSTRRAAGRRAPAWSRFAGYGGALALVAAAVAVLLVPLLGDEPRGAAGNGRAASGTGTTPAAPQPVQPLPGGTGAVDPEPQQSRGSTPGQGGGQDQGGGGPAGPGGGGGTVTWCPAGTAFYRAAAGGLEVTVNVAASGLVRAEVSLRGRAPQSRQGTATGGRPHSFRFAGVTEPMVERVKITTVSVGVAMQTCYARAGR
ncbi:hypothetical protein [Actinomadura rugatobispora]|uniref:Uncharacterized protein n=1 Tax=Actinomadura rugatobispora TaxID=1994 RepID=A0ABW0ZUB1_9ACTN|nr:hypothetical protein GCM10010200_086390 [Actinomadura rugatobispora]